MKEIDHLGLPANPKDRKPGLGVIIARLRRANTGWTEEQLRAEATDQLNQRLKVKADNRSK